MRVAHASDLHSNVLVLKNIDITKIEAFILTGEAKILTDNTFR